SIQASVDHPSLVWAPWRSARVAAVNRFTAGGGIGCGRRARSGHACRARVQIARLTFTSEPLHGPATQLLQRANLLFIFDKPSGRFQTNDNKIPALLSRSPLFSDRR